MIAAVAKTAYNMPTCIAFGMYDHRRKSARTQLGRQLSKQKLHVVHACMNGLRHANSGGPWLQASKKMLMENDFLQSLRSFDKDHIPVPVVQKIKPYIANPEFEPNKILTVSMHLCCVVVSAIL